MQIEFIGQGFNETATEGVDRVTSVGEAIANTVDGSNFDKLSVFTAFATEGGVDHLVDISEQDGVELSVHAFVGIDQQGTSWEGLERLLESDIHTNVFYANTITYHPKLYVFQSMDTTRVIIGSANLTQAGLFQNIEAAVQIDLNNDSASDSAFLTEMKHSFTTPIRRMSKPLTEERIDLYNTEDLLSCEADRPSSDPASGPESDIGECVEPQPIPDLRSTAHLSDHLQVNQISPTTQSWGIYISTRATENFEIAQQEGIWGFRHSLYQEGQKTQFIEDIGADDVVVFFGPFKSKDDYSGFNPRTGFQKFYSEYVDEDEAIFLEDVFISTVSTAYWDERESDDYTDVFVQEKTGGEKFPHRFVFDLKNTVSLQNVPLHELPRSTVQNLHRIQFQSMWTLETEDVQAIVELT